MKVFYFDRKFYQLCGLNVQELEALSPGSLRIWLRLNPQCDPFSWQGGKAVHCQGCGISGWNVLEVFSSASSCCGRRFLRACSQGFPFR